MGTNQRITQLCVALAFLAQGVPPKEVLTLASLPEYLDGENVTEKFFLDVERICESTRRHCGFRVASPLDRESLRLLEILPEFVKDQSHSIYPFMVKAPKK
jgi:hypothetical protein